MILLTFVSLVLSNDYCPEPLGENQKKLIRAKYFLNRLRMNKADQVVVKFVCKTYSGDLCCQCLFYLNKSNSINDILTTISSCY